MIFEVPAMDDFSISKEMLMEFTGRFLKESVAKEVDGIENVRSNTMAEKVTSGMGMEKKRVIMSSLCKN